MRKTLPQKAHILLGPKSVALMRQIIYYKRMKRILLLVLSIASFFPVHALDSVALERQVLARVIDEMYLSRYSASFEENARKAIRLGYDNFHIRFGTQQLTPTDVDILNFVKQELVPFATQLEGQTDESLQQSGRVQEVQTTFTKLAGKLAKLLYKNQQRYTNPLFINDEATLQEAALIITESLKAGSF